MALQPIDRQKFKQDSRTLKRKSPTLIPRKNKLLVESMSSHHGPQITNGFIRYYRELKYWEWY